MNDVRSLVHERLVKSRRRRMIYVFLLVFLSIIGVLVSLLALDDTLLYFRTPSDIQTAAPQSNERIRVGGMVVEGSVEEIEGEEPAWSFFVSDGEQELEVIHFGVLPDLFAEGKGMIAEGYYRDGKMNSDLILAKHDENYVPRTMDGASLYGGEYGSENHSTKADQ